MTVTKNAKEPWDFFSDGRVISNLEMGSDEINVFCSQGKINLWFSRQVDEPLVRQVVFGISNADPCASHELEVLCDFDTISVYESAGYTLISYSKTKNGYRTAFRLSFSKRFALDHFVRSIMGKLKDKGVKFTLHWDGSTGKIIHLYNELKRLNDIKIKQIEYKALLEKEDE